MSLVKPFRALYYNPQLIKNLSRVVCPPYDVIDKKQDAFLRKLSPYNFCRILRTDSHHTYKHLSAEFNRWLELGVLVESKNPCFYLYEQQFCCGNKHYRRVGFLGLLRIDKQGIVFPHERTFDAPKRDRYYILKELKANLSPIFVVVPGKVDALRQAYVYYRRKRSFINFDDCLRIKNRVWSIEDKETMSRIKKSFSQRNIFIAAGHHRFEVGYQYFKKMKGSIKDANYILAYFTDSSSGLLIFPIHRIVKTDVSKDKFLSEISRYFDIYRLDKKSFTPALFKKSSSDISFGLCANGNYYMIRLKSPRLLDIIFKKGKDSIYKKLEVYILHKLVLPKLKHSEITYTHSWEEALRRRRGKFSFIMKPTSIESVFDIAGKGSRLPGKSTYFYPKLLSGIVARRF